MFTPLRERFLEKVIFAMAAILRRFALHVFTLLIFGLLLATPGHAQYASGIEGTVLDQGGGAVSGAQCTVVNQDTQFPRSAVSDAQGFVRILYLPPGEYRIEIEVYGFQKWVQRDVQVEGNAVRSIYPKLTVGQQVMTVEVRNEAETLETTKGTISRTLEQETVAQSPLVGQNLYASVATLAPGVTGLGDASGSIYAAGSQGTNSFSSEVGFQINAAGQRQEANEYQVNGTTVNGNSRDGVVNLTPEPDTVAEVKIFASIFFAEKGRQSGALIELFTNPGTNAVHGTLSEMHTDAS